MNNCDKGSPVNIIIPLGGSGRRFSDAGYCAPKPFVRACGKEILYWVVDSLNVTPEDSLSIIYNPLLNEERKGNQN